MEQNNAEPIERLEPPPKKYEGLHPGFYWAHNPQDGFYPVRVYSLGNRADYDSLSVDISMFPSASRHDRCIHPDDLPFGISIRERIDMPGEGHSVHPAEMIEFCEAHFGAIRSFTGSVDRELAIQNNRLSVLNFSQWVNLGLLFLQIVALVLLAAYR